MSYSVYQHWDPLRVCVVGRTYPPEFYSWIRIPHVRELFEKIAVETEEDYQTLISKLESFGIKILRPDLDLDLDLYQHYGKFPQPPMTPRDTTIMIGDKFYESYDEVVRFTHYYNRIKDPSWPRCYSRQEFSKLSTFIKRECVDKHNFNPDLVFQNIIPGAYTKIYNHVAKQGNTIISDIELPHVNGASVSRIGKDLYFSTETYSQDISALQLLSNQKFPNYKNHVVNTGGHGDATYCPVCPGLIISTADVPTYAKTFPGWEVVYVAGQTLGLIENFKQLKEKNAGKWWIPGFEQDQTIVDFVEKWLGHWTGYVEETVFDVNMLIVDPKNVIVPCYNKQVFNALDRYGITPHVIPFRHRFFWDGGIHCMTSDLHREGQMQDYFPARS